MDRQILAEPIRSLIAQLESDDFYAEVAVASTPKAFYRRLKSHGLVRSLSESLTVFPDSGPELLAYADSLIASARPNVRPENDAALCACIFALSRTGLIGIDDVLRKLRNSKELALKWASYVADFASAEGARTTRITSRIGPGSAVASFSVPSEIADAEAHSNPMYAYA